MPRNITSNLIIKSSLPPPQGKGLTEVEKQLAKINRLMDSLNKKQVTVTVNLQGDKKALAALQNILQIARLAPKIVNNAPGAAGTGPVPPGGPTGSGLSFSPTGAATRKKTRTVDTEEGPSQTVTKTFGQVNLAGEKVIEKGIFVDGQLAATEEEKINILEEKNVDKAAKILTKREELAKRRRELAVNRIRGESKALRLQAAGFTEQPGRTVDKKLVPGINQEDTVRVREFTRAMADGRTAVRTFSEETGNSTKSTRGNIQVNRDQVQLQRAQAAQLQAGTDVLKLNAQGYTIHKERVSTATIAGQRFNSTLTEMRKISGSPLLGNLAVEIAKVDSATGRMTKEVLHGAEAMRLLGDRFTSAVAKVGLWFSAVSAIFLIANTARTAADDFKKLESNTVFLARVGKQLGNNFAESKAEAQLLTDTLIDQSVALGTLATDAQQAAGVFLRAGQTRAETAESTRVALLATSIAELEAEDSAKLFAAAQAQFNIQAKDTIFILDTVNTLSNQYRVSTDDLLQSISRSGKVFADANGSLEQLAAITAVVAEKTTRSGAEIGNAIKTIQSRLAAPEVTSALLDTLGITLEDSSGKMKDMVKLLLELQSALSSVSQAEKQRALVTIAGARQVNILSTAIDGAIDVVLANARALQKQASAESEAVQQSKTLEAALGRLRAQFTAMVNSSGGAFDLLVSGLVSTINILLKFANVFDGVLIKIGIFVIALISVRTALVKLQTATAIAAGFKALGDAWKAGAASATAMTTSTLSLSAALKSVNVQAALITGGISLLLIVFNAWDEHLAESAILRQQETANADKNATTIEREARAYRELSIALREQLAQKRRLLAEGKESPDNQTRIKQLARQIGQGKHTKGELSDVATGGVRTAADANALEARLAQGEQKATERSVKARRKAGLGLIDQLAAQQLIVDQKRERLAKLEAIRAGTESPEFVNQQILLRDGSQITVLKGEVAKAESELVDLNEQLEITAQTIADAGGANPVPYTKDILEARKAAADLVLEFNRLDKQRRTFAQITTGKSGVTEEAAELDLLTKKLTDLQAKMKATPASEAGIIEDYGKKIAKVTERVTELNTELLKSKLESFTEAFKGRFAARGEIFLASREAAASVNQTEGPFGDVQNVQAKLKATRELARIQIAAANELKGVDDAQKLAQADALRAEAATNLNKARELETDLAVQMLKTEADITKEKKKQNEETLKALGLLSDEDKAIVLAHASFFAQNPKAKISAEQQFFGDAEVNKLLQGSFAGRLAKFDPQQPFDQFLTGIGGFGPIESQVLAESEALQQKEYNQAGGRDNYFRNRIREGDTLGDRAITATGRLAPTAYSNAAPDVYFNPQININGTTLGLTPLLDKFENVTIAAINKIRAEMFARMTEVENKLRIDTPSVTDPE